MLLRFIIFYHMSLFNKLFLLVPHWFQVSRPHLHFTLQLYRHVDCDDKEMMDDLSGLGLRHVGPFF